MIPRNLKKILRIPKIRSQSSTQEIINNAHKKRMLAISEKLRFKLFMEFYMYGTHETYLVNITAQAQCDTHAVRMRGRYKSSSAKGRRRAMKIGVRKRNATGRRTLQPE
jgi:hypothetical protein